MKKLTIKQLQETLLNGLDLQSPEFRLQRSEGRIMGSIISSTFSGLRHQRQTKIWDLLEEHFGQDSWRLVGMLLAYTPDEWNINLPRHTKKSA